MRHFILLLALLTASFSSAQSTGTIAGKLTDKEFNNEPLAFANVLIKGTTKGTTSDFDGLYGFENIEPGSYTLVYSFVGYETREINVAVVAGKVSEVNVTMAASAASLDEVVITTTTKRESETALLLEQKKAVIIKESIGAEQLSRQGISDVASATTKISGVAKQEGSNKVYVRGLGDRYNSTTLNGLPLPSNDPSTKNIALDLFSTDLLQNIGISKSFASNLTGDVSGANIDIVAKELSGKSELTVGASTGVNTNTTMQNFYTIDGANWFGIAQNVKHPVKSLNTYAFDDSLVPNKEKAAPALSLSISGGKKFNISDESSLSVFLVGSFDNKYNYRDGLSINILNENPDGSLTKGSSYPSAKEYKYATNKMLMGNVVFKINPNHKLTYTTLYIQSNNQTIQDFIGTKPDVADSEGLLANQILQTEDQNQLVVNQLKLENKFGELWDVNASGAYNFIRNDQPNRKKTTFIINENDNSIRLASGTSRNNSRYFHNLLENDFVGQAHIIKYFGARNGEENKGKITIGTNGRYSQRVFRAHYFDYDLPSPIEIDPNNLENVFNQQGLDNGDFRFLTQFGFGNDAIKPSTYDAEKLSSSFYGNVEYKFNDKLFASAGVRYEINQMRVEWFTNLSNSDELGKAKVDKTYILPSLNLKYNLSEKSALRLSASQTYTYPQFKEVAPFVYEGVDYLEVGNPELKPSENFNTDLKWEFFPTDGELISATVFGKSIKDAINRVETNAAADRFFTYKNTGDAIVYGIEAELRKNLFSFTSENDEISKKINLGLNATYMHTNQKFKTSDSFTPTDNESQLEGAAPFILNADISYNNKKGDKETVASLVFNTQDKKIFAIGTVNGLESIYQKGVPMLDFIYKRQFNKKWEMKFSAKNILDPKFERFRDLPSKPITRSYKKGMDITLGISYNL